MPVTTLTRSCGFIREDEEKGQEQGLAWEEFKRSWDVLQEDEEGSLQSVVATIKQQQIRRRLLRDTDTIQRGIIRHLFIVIDLSASMLEKDLRPSRLELTLSLAETFIGEYFDQNPISQLGIIVTRDGIAEKLTELSGNPMEHIRVLKEKKLKEAAGEPSLQNALETARISLNHVPPHGSREVLVLFGSLTTCDPGNIFDTIERYKREKIRCSVIGLAAEIQLCRTMAKETNGTFGVVMNEPHYKDLLFELVTPPAIIATTKAASLVAMGFPKRIAERAPSMCMCHRKPVLGGYVCPQCSAKVCELPTDCDVCGLALVASPHLARSYHHLFPVKNFVEVKWEDVVAGHGEHWCFGCRSMFEQPPATGQMQRASDRFKCPECQQCFCLECDLFIHEALHNCPGCAQR
ncbi:Ssl1-like-domain-containing protein [Syncephalis pseudoplumigaleata]|uniref:General transcription and DNA repair factor IIH n=1 Tax=Syncephalis pseudoplumigaleata TaxID=1712513 RepID=A0A4V1J0X9_9FUNG|nr:Ssl1-like-domain-containing protein [Syncephalis pseudoplumigaleata]|eukprot:RKP23119.1 Ssl1-like-domain-containing protein [Syncephalis pseudoplumigaleata]